LDDLACDRFGRVDVEGAVVVGPVVVGAVVVGVPGSGVVDVTVNPPEGAADAAEAIPPTPRVSVAPTRLPSANFPIFLMCRPF
jgi:hypothetical protein